jgi:hypothetical protein
MVVVSLNGSYDETSIWFYRYHVFDLNRCYHEQFAMILRAREGVESFYWGA